MNPQYLGFIQKVDWCIQQINALCCKINFIDNSGIVFAAQFTIGDGGGLTPVNGATTYTNPVLIGKSPLIMVNGGGFLVLNTDYSFNSTTGTITLLGGRLFNTGEVWTILY